MNIESIGSKVVSWDGRYTPNLAATKSALAILGRLPTLTTYLLFHRLSKYDANSSKFFN